MGMTIEQIIKYLPAPICGDTVIGEEKQKEYDAHDTAVNILRKYQKLQADYENRLKADLKAILVELQLEIHELENPYPHDNDNLLPLAQHNAFYDAKSTIEDLVDEKINALKGKQKGKNEANNITALIKGSNYDGLKI